MAVRSIVVSPDHVTLRENAKLQITATPVDSLRQPVTGVSVRWTSDDTTIAVVDATGMVTARRAGSTSVHAAAGSVIQGISTAVVANSVALALGDSVSFDMPNGLAPSVVISLQAGDTIDLGFWSTLSAPRLVPDTAASQGRVLSQSGGWAGTEYVAIHGKMVAPANGAYVFQPSADWPARPCPPPSVSCAWSARGVVRARRSAPILAIAPYHYAFSKRIVEGQAATDSFSIQNVGAGSVSLVASAPAWTTVSPAGGTIGTYPASQRFLISASTSSPGIDTGSVLVSGVPTDVWNATWSGIHLWLRIDEPDVTLNTADTIVAIAASPTAELVGAAHSSGKLYRIDPQTGQLTTASSGLTQGSQVTTHVVYGGDSVLYVGQAGNYGNGPLIISAVASDGTLSTKATLASSDGALFGVSATHVLYTFSGSRLVARDLNTGAVDSVTLMSQPDPGLVLDPADGCVYYTITIPMPPNPAEVDLRRWCASTRADAKVAAVIGHVTTFDWAGLLYLTDAATGSIRVYGTAGSLLDTRWPAVTPSSIAVDTSGIFIPNQSTIRRLSARSY